MKIFVLGGDGFCGWPTSLRLSELGNDVTIVDNLCRRRIDLELGVASLTPISDIHERIDCWRQVSGRQIQFLNIDLSSDYAAILQAFKSDHPDVIVHFGEQRSAPYSMKTSLTNRFTIQNNLVGTNNICSAIVESGIDAHLIHLGTMGVYGYGTADLEIPEGYLNLELGGSNGREILYPANPGSIYHMSKCQDQLFFLFYNKNYQLRITDLHQGIVWGTQTDLTRLDEKLINRFDYDGDYGTVLNRFLTQAAIGYPLTVHGTGGQTRAFIHITDTVQCIEIAMRNPPDKHARVKIYNQMTETHRVRGLAELVAGMTGAEISFLQNPRKEADENDLKVSNECFLAEGLEPTRLAEGLLTEVIEISQRYAERIDTEKIPCASFW